MLFDAVIETGLSEADGADAEKFELGFPVFRPDGDPDLPWYLVS